MRVGVGHPAGRAPGEVARPLPGSGVIVVDVRDSKDARGGSVGVAAEALETSDVTTALDGAERAERRLPALQQLAVRRLDAQTVGVIPVRRLLVVGAQGG